MPVSSKGNQHELQFNNCLVEFISKLRQLVPSMKKKLASYYRMYRTFVDQEKRLDFIEQFLSQLSPWQTYLATYDEHIFSDDFHSGKVELLKSIDFREIWRQLEDHDDETKENIFRYFHSLTIIGSHVLKEHQRFTNLLKKHDQLVAQLTQSMRMESKIKQDAVAFETIAQSSSNNQLSTLSTLFKGFDEIFKEDNFIVQLALDIAEELAQELKITSQTHQSPQNLLKTLFNEQNLVKLTDQITQKLKQKMEQEGLTEQDLLDQIQSISDQFKQVPCLNVLSEQIASVLSSPGASVEAEAQHTDVFKQCLEQISNLVNLDSQLDLNDLHEIIK